MTDLLDIDVRRLRLGPGDLVVVRSTDDLDEQTAARIRTGLRELLDVSGHTKTRVIVLGPRLSLEVLGEGDIPDGAK